MSNPIVCDRTFGSYKRGCRCSDCRAANAAYMRVYYAKNRERLNAKNRVENMSPERAELRRGYQRKYRREDPERIRGRERAYKLANPERTKAKKKREWDKNREAYRVRAADYYQRNKESTKARAKRWSDANRDRINARIRERLATDAEYATRKRAYHRLYRQYRRGLEKNAPGTFTKEQIQARIDYYGGKCYLCGAPYEHLDHVIPLSRGGSNWPANIRPACARCNCSKKDKKLHEYLALTA